MFRNLSLLDGRKEPKFILPDLRSMTLILESTLKPRDDSIENPTQSTKDDVE